VRGLDPRTTPKQVGVVLALSSELMFFAGLFAAWFFLEADTAEWPPSGTHLDATLPAVCAAVIVFAAVSVKLGQDRLLAGSSRAGARLLVAGAVLGLAYCALTIVDWSTLGFGIGDSAYASLYYAMTGLHLIHVVVGVVALGVLWHAWEAASEPDPADVRIVAYFWYWLAALWLAMFGVVFLIG